MSPWRIQASTHLHFRAWRLLPLLLLLLLLAACLAVQSLLLRCRLHVALLLLALLLRVGGHCRDGCCRRARAAASTEVPGPSLLRARLVLLLCWYSEAQGKAGCRVQCPAGSNGTSLGVQEGQAGGGSAR